jgi:hypothetical protein
MESKRIIWLCTGVGGFIGGYIPLLWGAGLFSFSALFFNAIGAIVGIWIGFRLTH